MHGAISRSTEDAIELQEPGVEVEEVDELDALDDMDDEAFDSTQGLLSVSSKETDLETVSTLYLIGLTISTGGLQVIWTAIMSQGSPYLYSLSVPTYLISLVWLAGPLSGALIQPYVGILSDRCENPLGRRRPFIIFGTIATIVCILALPWTTDLIGLLFTIFGSDPEGHAAMICKGAVAAGWIWALNIAIQPVQGGLRAIIVDCAPKSQQVRACAYASVAAGIGSILGYTTGYVSLPKYLPWLGNTQLKGLCLVASMALGLTVAITCSVVKEKPFIYLDMNANKKSFLGTFREIFRSIRAVPNSIRKICLVQFFAWVGWFPFLFYITTYLGDIYEMEYTSITKKAPLFSFPSTSASLPASPHSIRHATFIMILFSIVALTTNLTLPHFIASPSTSTTHKNYQKPKSTILQHLYINIPRPTLAQTWTISHILYSLLTLSTILTSSFAPTSILVSLLGVSWAITQWIPLALINLEISSTPDLYESSSTTLPTHKNPNRPLQAGTILGLYNISIATPQIIAAVQGSVVFWVLGRVGIVGGDAMGWVIRLGCVAGVVAAWVASRL